MRDSEDKNKVKYVGITNNPARRKAEHRRDKNKSTNNVSWTMYVWTIGKTKKEARLIENSLICIDTIDALANARYEIAVKNIPGFQNEIKRAASLLKVPQKNLENLLNRTEWR